MERQGLLKYDKKNVYLILKNKKQFTGYVKSINTDTIELIDIRKEPVDISFSLIDFIKLDAKFQAIKEGVSTARQRIKKEKGVAQ